MIIGYQLGGYDNGTVMFEKDCAALEKCPACGYRIDFFAHNPLYRQARKRRSDLLCTYDGAEIVTQNFKAFCLENSYQGVNFLEFRNDPDHFHLQTERIVPFDAKRRGTRFISYCPFCENYESIIGANPDYLKVQRPLQDGIYRTDLLFGPKNAKSPLLLVGCETKAKMESANLKGLLFEEIES